MTAQRKTGILLSIFTSFVVLNHAVRLSFTWYDFVYIAILIPLIFSSIVECKASKVSQVVIFAFTGLLMVYAGDDSVYLGVVIVAISYMYSYTYGLLDSRPILKSSVIVFIFVSMVFIATGFDIVQTILWTFMCSMVFWSFWVNAKDLIAKAARADELENQLLKSQLENATIAGTILVNEIKHQGASYGRET